MTFIVARHYRNESSSPQVRFRSRKYTKCISCSSMHSSVLRMHTTRCSSHVRAYSEIRKRNRKSTIHCRSYTILADRSRRDGTIPPVPLHFIGNNRERASPVWFLEKDRRGNYYSQPVCRTFCSVCPIVVARYRLCATFEQSIHFNRSFQSWNAKLER